MSKISVMECLRDQSFSGGFRRITKQQACLISLKYPLESGWKKLCEDILLSEEEAEEFKKYSVENRKHMTMQIKPFCNRVQVINASPSRDFYNSLAWRKVRYAALRKLGGNCSCCGRSYAKDGVTLHVDHIKPRSLFPHLELDIANLQVLCEDCNIGKGNSDSISWKD